MKRRFFLFALFAVFCPLGASADNGVISIAPFIIDEKVKIGDILKYDLDIKSNSANKVNIYAVVNDVLKTEGDVAYNDPSELDRNVSLVRWISFKRGVIELMPGASTSIPLEINIPSTALPGKRFARIALPTGSNRPDAEGGMAANAFTQLPINIEIVEDIIEKAQIKGFSAAVTVFVKAPVSFDIKLENNGNKAATPRGNIYIYNRRGEEIASLAVNSEAQAIAPSELWTEKVAWENLKGLGKFKAKLEVEYGEKDKRDLQDTLYFWYFPWQFLLIIFVGTFLFLTIMVTLIFYRTYNGHQFEEPAKLPVRRAKAASKKIINLKK